MVGAQQMLIAYILELSALVVKNITEQQRMQSLKYKSWKKEVHWSVPNGNFSI